MRRIRITDEYSLVKRKGSANWYLEWRERGQKARRTTGTADAGAARVAARELILAGIQLDHEPAQQVLVCDMIERYKMQRGEGLASRDVVRRALKLWREFWGDASVADVTVTRQEQFADALFARGLSSGYVRRVLSVGKAALNRAWKRGEIAQVPHVELPADGEAYPHRATLQQLVRLLNTPMPQHVFNYIIVRLSTGCRGDAALDLQAFQIDRAARLVRLNPQGRTQTKKYRPTVPLTNAFERFLDTSAVEAHVVSWRGRRVGSIKTTWRHVIARAGLPAWFAPKVLRHTVATELRSRGVSEWEVAGLMGHRRGVTDRYAKFAPDYLSDARRALDAIMQELAIHSPRLRGVIGGVSAGSVPYSQQQPTPAETGAVVAFGGGGRDRDRTCDPYHVKVSEYRTKQGVTAQEATPRDAEEQQVATGAGSVRGQCA